MYNTTAARYTAKRANKWAGKCCDCGQMVPAGIGVIFRVGSSRWIVAHHPLRTVSPSGPWDKWEAYETGGCPTPAEAPAVQEVPKLTYTEIKADAERQAREDNQALGTAEVTSWYWQGTAVNLGASIQISTDAGQTTVTPTGNVIDHDENGPCLSPIPFDARTFTGKTGESAAYFAEVVRYIESEGYAFRGFGNQLATTVQARPTIAR